VPTFADRGCHVVSVTNPTAVFSDFFQVAPQFYSRIIIILIIIAAVILVAAAVVVVAVAVLI
jgi:hypothetical protein